MDDPMPLLRYFTVMGSVLLGLMLLADWYLPKPVEPARHEARVSGIRIASQQKLPERVVYDTTLPTIVPPPQPEVAVVAAPLANLPREAFALATPVSKPVAAPVRKKPKVASRTVKRQNFQRLAAVQSRPVQSGWPTGW